MAGRSRCTFRLEREAWAEGYHLIAGFDEAGRGCLFGPVYAAAVILDSTRTVRGLNDSKQLDASTRERLASLIRDRSVAHAVASATAKEIDRINIYQASRLAMRRAFEMLSPQPDFLLVDALRLDCATPQRAVIRGDSLSRSIAAASILAKVERDQAMAEWDERFPGYGIASHKGYCTPAHLDALARLGPTPEHRYSFEPVRNASGPAPQLGLFAEA